MSHDNSYKLLLLNWLSSSEQDSLTRAFTVWFNRVLLPRKMSDTEFANLQEVQTMLAETVKSWANKARQQGRHEGMEEGLEKGIQKGIEKGRQQQAAKLFLLLLDSRFGEVSDDVQTKIHQASPEEIEKWTKQIFQAETPEALLSS